MTDEQAPGGAKPLGDLIAKLAQRVENRLEEGGGAAGRVRLARDRQRRAHADRGGPAVPEGR